MSLAHKMNSISREDYGYFDAPPSDEELQAWEEERANREMHNELEREEVEDFNYGLSLRTLRNKEKL
jgi:hypothetical protein